MNASIQSLSADDPRAVEALRSGWLSSSSTSAQRAVARSVIEINDRGSAAQIIFELLPSQVTRPAGLHPWLQAMRAFSLTATLTPCIATYCWLRGSVNFVSAILAVFGVGFLQIAINIFNDVEDYRRLIDLPSTPGGSGVIQQGWWTPLQLRVMAWGSLFLGAFCGIPLLFIFPQVLIPIAGLAGAGVLFYSSRRYGLKYNAFGDLTVWILCGPALTSGFALATGGSWSMGTFWVGSFFGFLAASLLHVNNLQDMELDRRRSVKTLAIALGFSRSMKLLIGFQGLAAVSLLVGVLRGELPYLSLLGAVAQGFAAVPWLIRIRTALGPESAVLAQSRVQAAKIHLMAGLGLTAGLLIYWSRI